MAHQEVNNVAGGIAVQAHPSVQNSITLPAFVKNDPQVWFIMADRKLNRAGITDEEDKYEALTAALDYSVSAEVRDLLTNKPDNEPYTTIKNALLSRIGPSLRENMRKLLAMEELGDRKATALLRDVTKSFGDPAAQLSDFFKQLYLDKLPENIRNILAMSQHNTTIEVLAKQADQIYDSGNHSTNHQVHAINARPNNQSNQSKPNKQEAEITLFSIFKMITEMSAKIATLEGQMRQLNSTAGNNQDRGRMQNSNNSSHPRNRSQLNKRNANNQDSGTASTFCWYHEKYAEKALKCGENCNFNDAAQTQGY
jgi:HEPN domain-containing protein